MRTVTATTYRGLAAKGKVATMGTTPCLIHPSGTLIPIRVNPECGTTLVVECYGGGTRWYCPRCDASAGWSGWSGHPTISYVNGLPPADRTCHRPGN